MDQLAQIKAVFDDGIAEINGTLYEFTKFTHAERLKVFSFYSGLVKNHATGEVRMDFWDDPAFHVVQKLIDSKILVEGVQVSKREAYWDQDENVDDFVPYILTALQVITYPFLRGGRGV